MILSFFTFFFFAAAAFFRGFLAASLALRQSTLAVTGWLGPAPAVSSRTAETCQAFSPLRRDSFGMLISVGDPAAKTVGVRNPPPTAIRPEGQVAVTVTCSLSKEVDLEALTVVT